MTSDAGLLEGRVAQIISARELAINIGRAHGVRLGMRFAVLAETPLQIRDPATKEVLDTLDREKVRIEVSELRERISICKTYRSWTTGRGTPLPNLDVSLFLPPRRVYETLEAKDYDKPPPLSEEDSYVKINDRVVQVPTERES